MLGVLVDAGVPFSLLEEVTRSLNIGAHLAQHKTMRGGLTGTKINVIAEEENSTHHAAHTHDPASQHGPAHTHDHEHSHAHGHTPEHEHTHDTAHAHSHEKQHKHEHRSLSCILAILAAAPLPERVKTRATRAFQMLGEAEAAIHNVPVESVHFHEVGAVDTIVDIVCSAAGAEFLQVDRWIATPLNVGSGTVQCAHGVLPVPAPATLKLLGDAPIYARGAAMERVTPTGAAILRMLNVRYESLPPMRVEATGYGAGGRDTPGESNLLRLVVGELTPQSGISTEEIAILETVMDDANPQLLSYVSDLLLAAGAWDVYRVPVHMKKGRAGVQLTVLCAPDKLPLLRELIFRETTTIGLHWRIENKMALAREFAQVQTQWGAVSIKIARWPNGDEANANPEYEDCRKLAEQHHVPLKLVLEEAMRVYAGTRREK